MTDAPLTAKQLVKDGVWQVPPEQRPKGWEAMSIRECIVEHTEVRQKRTTTRRVEVAEPRPEVVDVIPEQCFIEAPNENPQTASALVTTAGSDIQRGQIISWLPENDPDISKEVLDKCVRYFGTRRLTDAELDTFCDELGEASVRLEFYRNAKEIVDLALSGWLDKHRKQIRHIGASSAPIKDLWSVVHGLVFEEMARWKVKLDRKENTA